MFAASAELSEKLDCQGQQYFDCDDYGDCGHGVDAAFGSAGVDSAVELACELHELVIYLRCIHNIASLLRV
ncbi:hypothetical protein [Rhodococcoides fascians]|uniref:hypothetical protein n=1 Tax=Rhodococcoides fascians TaxID=1828 RepID=UPI0012D35C06|nr:hypothetical protein [Rhodococcus fascians]